MRILKNIVRKELLRQINYPMKIIGDVQISESLNYHIKHGIPLINNIFEIYSKSFLNLINEVRYLFHNGLIDLNENDIDLVESDLGKLVTLESGQKVYLEVPIEDKNFLTETEYKGRKVQLGKIMQGDIKKFKVYVKNDKGNVVKVNFGFGGKSAKGKRMVIKKNNPARRKSFRARHNCDNPGPRWKARYWACRTW